MLGRLFTLMLWLALGAALGFSIAPKSHQYFEFISIGMLAAVSCAHLISGWHAENFLNWLQKPVLDSNKKHSVLWESAADRIIRLIKNKESQRLVSEESLRQFLAAIQASPHGVIILDSETRIQWSNQTASEHLGLDPKLDLQQLIGNMLRNPVFSNYVNSKSFDHEVIIEGRDHRIDSPHKVGIQLFPYGDGRMLLLSRDVTLIEQAETMRRDFVANVSHEIRTPLTVLAGFIETLQTLPLSKDEQEKYLNLMSNQAFRMKSLIDDLLTLSRIEGRHLPGQQEWVSIKKILMHIEEEAVGLSVKLHPLPQDRQRIIFQLGDQQEETEISGSASELTSAFSNLISNAIRYTPASGTIKVNWKTTDTGGIFCVTDSGPGIAPEHFSRLSERFYRIDRSRSRDTGGTGLGLAIVKHVIQRHEGVMEIESKINAGSKFSLLFPMHRLRVTSGQTQVEAINGI
jgi:two-component system, OmpR family, phosphate regulon sensor histidine kinase PhoR